MRVAKKLANSSEKIMLHKPKKTVAFRQTNHEPTPSKQHAYFISVTCSNNAVCVLLKCAGRRARQSHFHQHFHFNSVNCDTN